jgi:hypothetical protein
VTIYELLVTPGREEHIARHHVSVAEVEAVAFGNPFVSRSRQGRFHLIGEVDSRASSATGEDSLIAAFSFDDRGLLAL